MRWKGKRQSDNFEDRRGMSGGKLALGGIGGLIVVVLGLLLGGDPQQLLQQLQSTGNTEQGPAEISPEEQELTEFARVVLASTEDVWATLYREQQQAYRPASLVVYRDGTQTDGCGFGATANGPFYCPADEKVYIDLSFNEELQNRFGATGEFAMAYVIAHEVGHHIQLLQGTLPKVQGMRGELSERAFNKLMVQLELQADFYAGVWAHHANKASEVYIDESDIEDGIAAASAVGDDRLQMQSQGYVVPDAFTHGTSAQRAYWFRKGFETGDLRQGDTFSSPDLQ